MAFTINTIPITFLSIRNQSREQSTNSKITLSSLYEKAWTSDGIEICLAVDDSEKPQICSDGNGGSIITWQDSRNGSHSDIYVQKVDSNGAVKWMINGVPICTEPFDQRTPRICSDGEGGAIITWKDYRRGPIYADVYAQHVNSTGNTQWGSNGIVICNASDYQTEAQICSDGAGGAIICWRDKRSGIGYDIFAQKVDSNGIIQWENNGSLICNAIDGQYTPQICNDGTGGAIITWQDMRSGSYWDIYAQLIDSTGDIEWVPNGTAISTALIHQQDPQICIDEAGGAIICWRDGRSGTNYDIFAQRIGSNGIVQWENNGSAICTAVNDQFGPQICIDGAGGAIITWYDNRSGSGWDIYAQNVNLTGDMQWVLNGTDVSTANIHQRNPQICSDGTGGAIISWEDGRSGTNYDIYAQLIDSNGAPQWKLNGSAMCNAYNDQFEPDICSDGAGGAIFTWYDYRNGNANIFAQYVKKSLPPAPIPIEIIIIASVFGSVIVVVITVFILIRRRKRKVSAPERFTVKSKHD